MTTYAEDDLLGLDDAPSSSPISPTTAFGLFGKSMSSTNRRTMTHSDSFSSLEKLMRAKKPYTPIPPPTPEPSLAVATNGTQFAYHQSSGSSILSPTAKPASAAATSGLEFKSCYEGAASILSPTAQPFVGLESATAWVQEQEHGTSQSSRRVSDDLGTRLALLASQMNDISIDEPAKQRSMTPCSPANLSSPSTLLLPGFTTPPQIGPIAPPTPTDSAQHHVSAYHRSNTPVVRLTKDVWDSMGNELSTLSKKNRDLEQRLASAERNYQTLRNEDHDVGAQIGKLRYQNEANREQKATMGRALAEKDIEIKTQQLEIDSLGKKVVDLETEIHRLGKMVGDAEWLRTAIKDNEAVHARDLKTKTAAMKQLEKRLAEITHELDSAKQAQKYAEDHAASTQRLPDALSKREKLITDLRFELLQEKERWDFLEDEVNQLREQVNQGSMDKLKAELREKSSLCDRIRTELKGAVHQYKVTQTALNRALNGGEALRGGAHLVVPHENSKLPKKVISCSECYAQNIPCDNGARCQNCTLKSIQCARWRCSLKHKLLECPDHPCQLPHDPQGWLMTLDARPEW